MSTEPDTHAADIPPMSGMTRRSFIKRTAATAVVTALALHAFRNEVTAAAGGGYSETIYGYLITIPAGFHYNGQLSGLPAAVLGQMANPDTTIQELKTQYPTIPKIPPTVSPVSGNYNEDTGVIDTNVAPGTYYVQIKIPCPPPANANP